MKKSIFLIILLAICFGAFSQSSVNASGGDFSGTSCSVSYSVGQVGYNAYAGDNISFGEGVQQPYEIYDITEEAVALQDDNSAQRGTLEVEETTRNITLSAYPNPTDDFLNLVVDGDGLGAMKCAVYDVSGRQISDRSISVGETSPTYFVRVTDDGRILKTFKIVKN